MIIQRYKDSPIWNADNTPLAEIVEFLQSADLPYVMGLTFNDGTFLWFETPSERLWFAQGIKIVLDHQNPTPA